LSSPCLDRKGQISSFTYDGLNRRTFAGFGKRGNSYSISITYTYDAGNRITKLVDTRAGTITRTFDDLDRADLRPRAQLTAERLGDQCR
jgi:uncharacterized protein RhaS with RHS repeats